MGSQDTEITLGTGKMLALFFGLVALCGLFFGLGFSLGRGSVAPGGIGQPTANLERTGVASLSHEVRRCAEPELRHDLL